MKKKLLSLLLTVTMLFAMAVPALAAVEDTGFADVSADAWYAEAVEYVRAGGLMSGTGATAFSPDESMTRAMLAVVLYRVAGSPAVTGSSPFTDVADGSWCADAVLWASQNGIVSGYGNSLFGANDSVSREQIATILWRYAGSPAADAGTDFADEGTIASYASNAVDWARANGVINGIPQGTLSSADGGIHLVDGNIFSPKSSASRAQVATILMNYTRGEQATPTPDPEPTPDPVPEGGTKVLVAYFSATGNTRPLAEYVADALSADIYEITPETPYTSADLNYGDSSSRTSIEMNDPASRPAISGSVENMEQYDVVFLGYPIWWGDAPHIISTFLESYEFSGKTIVPFCTSGSSGMGSSATGLHALTDGANWLSGRRFSSGTSRATMVEWVNGLGLDITAE